MPSWTGGAARRLRPREAGGSRGSPRLGTLPCRPAFRVGRRVGPRFAAELPRAEREPGEVVEPVVVLDPVRDSSRQVSGHRTAEFYACQHPHGRQLRDEVLDEGVAVSSLVVELHCIPKKSLVRGNSE
jgi:hypothetical protein